MKEILQQSKVIPVIVIDDLKDAIPLASALVNGGLTTLEITLRTQAALEAIFQIKQALPNAIVGSGTVTDIKTLQASIDAGVDFIVSPGSSPKLLSAASQNDIPFLPGATTPTEVMNLLENGYQAMKFFPAEASGGIKMLKSIAGPLPQATFCPTGGINPANAGEYLKLANVVCVGGTWMLDKKLIAAQNWSEITNLSKQACLI